MRISYTEPCTTVIPIQLRHCVTGGRFTGRRAAGTAGGAKRVSSGGLGEAVSLVGEDISLWIDYDMFGKLHHNIGAGTRMHQSQKRRLPLQHDGRKVAWMPRAAMDSAAHQKLITRWKELGGKIWWKCWSLTGIHKVWTECRGTGFGDTIARQVSVRIRAYSRRLSLKTF